MNIKINKRQRGFTLIELMVALLLGLLVVAAAGSIFLSNRRVYGSTEAISRIQENQRAAFELISRDIREAGVNPCSRFDATNPLVVQVTAPDAQFWQRFANGVVGGANAGRDFVALYLANGLQYRVQQHTRPGNTLTLNSAAGIAVGQTALVCNSDRGIAFMVTGVSGSALQHAAGSNCGGEFTSAPDASKCAEASAGPGYCFRIAGTPTAADTAACPGGIGRSPAFVVTPYEARWTVEDNGRGATSLYRTAQNNRSEIAEGVSAMTVRYKVGTSSSYVDAATVEGGNNWGQVTAIHLAMTFQAVQGAMAKDDPKGMDGSALSRTMDDYIVLRNHQDDIQ